MACTAGLRPAGLLLGLVLLAGCSTDRTLWIESEPPGATVWVNGKELGSAPVPVDFVHYGRFEVRLEKEGYEALAQEVEVPSQIDGYPIVDLPFEFTVRERHFLWRGRMRPIPRHPTEADLQRVLREAQAFRAEARRETGPSAVPPRRPRAEPPPLNPGGFPGR